MKSPNMDGWIGGVGGCIVELEHEAITFTK